MKKCLIFLLFFSFFYVSVFPQQDKSSIIRRRDKTEDEKSVKGIDAGKQYLFLVAIDQYMNWNPLRGPVSEARELKKVFKTRYHIDEVKELYNEQATKEAIKDYIISLQEGKKNELQEKDSLIIYFSGHGQAFEEEPYNGYWIPYDGGGNTIARAYWINNSELIGLIKKIKANHILIVSDSCFAATLVDTRRGNDTWISKKEYLHRFYNRRSRKVLTSGGMEHVPGKSEFALLFKNELKKNQKSWINIDMIYHAINKKVFEKTKNYPEFGNLKDTEFDPSASFVLFTREGWEKLVSPKIGLVDWQKRREKEIKQFETRCREIEKLEKEGKLYMKNWEIKERYQKISEEFGKYFDDFKKDKRLEKMIDRINQKIVYYGKKPDYVNIRIRVYPYADVYINGEFIGEVPPQKIKRNLQEGNSFMIKLVKEGKEFTGEFYVKNNRVHWVKKINALAVTLEVSD